MEVDRMESVATGFPRLTTCTLGRAVCRQCLVPQNLGIVDPTYDSGAHAVTVETQQTRSQITDEKEDRYMAGAVQAERQHRLRLSCSESNLSHVTLKCSKFEVIQDYQLLIGLIPKCGGTNWARLLLTLLGFHSASERLEPREANQELYRRVRYLYAYNASRQRFLLDNFRRVLFVRNPYTRLLSAFRDRLEAYPNRFLGQRRQYNKVIYTKFENHTAAETPDPSVPSELYNVTFRGFVDFYLSGHIDVHWQEQHKICHPCLRYDFLGKVETYDADVAEVLKLIDADPKYRPYKALNPTHSDREENLSKYYATLTDDQFMKLRKKLQTDMDYFGYSVPESIRRPHIEE
ncbi:carbohydrate sulfotransferase 12-like [Diadema setosum]|uniref:carbohydrate sulfotransferase 12-like n=1 Tax=Diadema setosum TaxID=31175 RepID=UPI003B3A5856